MNGPSNQAPPANWEMRQNSVDRTVEVLDGLETELYKLQEVFIAEFDKLRAQMRANRTADRRYFTSALAVITVVLFSAMAKGFHWI